MFENPKMFESFENQSSQEQNMSRQTIYRSDFKGSAAKTTNVRTMYDRGSSGSPQAKVAIIRLFMAHLV